MVNLNNVYGSNEWLKASDLQGRDWTLTIADTGMKEFSEGDRKIILNFQGTDKAMVCNFTNASTIANMFGDETEGWVGQTITIYPTRVTFGNKLVDAIRVREPSVQTNQGVAPMQHYGQPQQQTQAPVKQQPTEQNQPAQGAPFNEQLDDDIPF